MKHFPILQGRAYVVELPDGATNPEVHTRSLTFDTPMEVDEWGYDYQSVKLPEGTWEIVGLLPEVTEAEAAGMVDNIDYDESRKLYSDYVKNEWTPVALESLESAIVAEGHTFENKLTNPDDVCYFSRDRMIEDVKEFHEAQSRVLDRSRCLLLGREDEN